MRWPLLILPSHLGFGGQTWGKETNLKTQASMEKYIKIDIH
jgi:hypothetical protein